MSAMFCVSDIDSTDFRQKISGPYPSMVGSRKGPTHIRLTIWCFTFEGANLFNFKKPFSCHKITNYHMLRTRKFSLNCLWWRDDIIVRVTRYLIHFMPLFYIYTLGKPEKNRGFLIFSAVIGRDQSLCMKWVETTSLVHSRVKGSSCFDSCFWKFHRRDDSQNKNKLQIKCISVSLVFIQSKYSLQDNLIKLKCVFTVSKKRENF